MDNITNFNGNELQVLNIDGVDCYEKDGTVYLRLENVARGLGFTRYKNGTEYVMWDRVEKYLSELGFHTSVENSFATSGKRPDFIPENIFYRLAMKAKNETAEKFQAKVADEIIPTIRKTGGYVANDELFVSTYLPNADENTKMLFRATLTVMKEQSRKLDEQKPLVDFAIHVSQSKDSIDMEEMAKIARDEHIDIGRNRLFKWLRKHRILTNKNTPYQEYINRGYFDVIEAEKNTMYGTKVFAKVLITGKGQMWLTEKLRNEYYGNAEDGMPCEDTA